MTRVANKPTGKKSVRLTSDERRAFAKWVKAQGTIKEAAETLGVMPFTVNRILIMGSCAPDTHGKIKSIAA